MATLCLYLIVTGVKLVEFHFDVSRFVLAGDRFVDRNKLAHPIHVEKQSAGYDGQFYYRFALNPVTHAKVQYGITLDGPVVRAQRILYPITVWLLSLGQGELVPYFMVFVNLFSIVGLAWVGQLFVAQFNVSRWYGLLFPFYPGFVLSLSRDTAEIFAAFLGLMALYLALSGRRMFAVIAAVAAVLARETTLLYLAGFGMISVWSSIRQKRFDPGVLIYAIPVVAFLSWQVILFEWWGSLPFSDVGVHDLGLPPLAWYFSQIKLDVTAHGIRLFRYIYDLLTLILIIPFSMVVTRAGKPYTEASAALKLSWLCYLALACLFTNAIWVEPYGYLRILSDFYVLGCACLIASRRLAALRLLLPCAIATWLMSCV